MFIMPIKQFVNTVAMMLQKTSYQLSLKAFILSSYLTINLKMQERLKTWYILQDGYDDTHYYRWNIFCITIQLYILNHNDFTVQNNAFISYTQMFSISEIKVSKEIAERE